MAGDGPRARRTLRRARRRHWFPRVDRHGAPGAPGGRRPRGRPGRPRRRQAPARSAGTRQAGRLDPPALAGVDAVVNLAGAGIGDQRWTEDYKRRGAREPDAGDDALLAEAIAAAEGGPRVLLSGSAVGFYGDRGDEELDETRRRAPGSSPTSSRAWEASTAPAEAAGRRVVHLRTGIVLRRRAAR